MRFFFCVLLLLNCSLKAQFLIYLPKEDDNFGYNIVCNADNKESISLFYWDSTYSSASYLNNLYYGNPIFYTHKDSFWSNISVPQTINISGIAIDDKTFNLIFDGKLIKPFNLTLCQTTLKANNEAFALSVKKIIYTDFYSLKNSEICLKSIDTICFSGEYKFSSIHFLYEKFKNCYNSDVSINLVIKNKFQIWRCRSFFRKKLNFANLNFRHQNKQKYK